MKPKLEEKNIILERKNEKLGNEKKELIKTTNIELKTNQEMFL